MSDLLGKILEQHGVTALVAVCIVIGGGYAIKTLWNALQKLQEKRQDDMVRLVESNAKRDAEVDRSLDKLTILLEELARRSNGSN